jgi:hypothetical protein
VAVSRLLHNSGDDLADAIDVLVVHHRALGLADSLQDDLLGGLGGDAAEIAWRHLALVDLLERHPVPVDVEVVVGDERVRALPVLLLGGFELLQCLLSCLVEQSFLKIRGQVDCPDEEVAAAAVERDLRVALGLGCLLVCGEQRILERRDQGLSLDPLNANNEHKPKKN